MQPPAVGTERAAVEAVTPDNLHDRAERVAVPDFDHLGQTIEAIANGLPHPHRTPADRD